VATHRPNTRRRRIGQPQRRAWLVWVGVALLSALLLVTAELAQVYPLPGMALLLSSATVLFWYRTRYVD
jgi:hypothetical protein